MTNGGNLKSGWKTWRFDQIAINVNERIDDPSKAGVEHYVGLEHLDPDSLKIRRWGTPDDVEATKLCFKKGDIIFGRRRAYQRKLGVAEFDGICSAHAMVLRPRTDVVLPEFLPFFMQSDLFMQRAVEISVGSLSPTINWKTLAVQQFALPPLEKQQRILECLLALEEQIEALKASELAHARLIESRVSIFLDRWDGSAAKMVEKLVADGPRNGLSPKVNASETGFPTLSLSAVRNGKIITDGNIKYADVSETEIEPFLLRQNDVLVVRGNGNKFLTGKCGLVNTFPIGCFYPDLLIRLRFDENVIRTEFAVMQWNSASTHNSLISRAKSTNGIWKINGADIRKHTLIVPPLTEQDSLIKEMRVQQGVASSLAKRLQSATQMKTVFMQQYVAGGA